MQIVVLIIFTFVWIAGLISQLAIQILHTILILDIQVAIVVMMVVMIVVMIGVMIILMDGIKVILLMRQGVVKKKGINIC